MSEDSISLSFVPDHALNRRAMLGILLPGFFERLLGFAILFAGIVAAPYLAVAVMRTNHHPVIGLSAAFGAIAYWCYGCLWGSWRLQKRVKSAMSEAKERGGTVAATFDAQGVEFSDRTSHLKFSWENFDDIVGVRGGIALRSGTSAYVIPDQSLPEGFSPETFRARLEAWRIA